MNSRATLVEIAREARRRRMDIGIALQDGFDTGRFRRTPESPVSRLDARDEPLEMQTGYPTLESIDAATENVLEMVHPDRLVETYVRLMTYQNTLLASRARTGRGV